MDEAKTTRRQVNFRLSEEEAAKVMRSAENAGLSLSAYVKKLAVSSKVKPMVIDREQGRRLIAELGKIGSNVNQIAKVANQSGGVDAAALSRLQESIDAFWAYILDGKKPQPERKLQPESEPRRSAPTSATADGAQQAQKEGEKTPQAPICEGCGAEMRLCRRKQDGKPFWGCPNFRDTSVKHSVFDVEG